MQPVLGTVGWNIWSNGLRREGKGTTAEIFPVKCEDWIKKLNSAKSIFQRTQHKHVVSTLAQSRKPTATGL